MKRQKVKKIIGFILLAVLILEMIVLCWEALTPGKASAAQSGAVGDVLDDVMTDIAGGDDIRDVPPESVHILASGKAVESVEVGIGNTLRLTADILPKDTSANHRKLEWSTSDPAVVTVQNGQLRAVSIGTATVTVALEYDPQIAPASVHVTVNEVFAQSFTLTFSDGKTETTLKEGRTAALKTTFTPSNVTAKDVKYASDNTDVATVNASGVVRAISVGDATITATYTSRTTRDGEHVVLSQKVTVHVEEDDTVVIPPTSLTLKYPPSVVYVGEKGKLEYEIAPADCTDRLLVWSSSPENVLKVHQDGSYEPLAKGVATVRVASASVPTLTQEVTIEVRNRALNAVLGVTGATLSHTEEPSEYALSVSAGSNVPLSVTSDITEIFVKYGTDDASIAEIDEGGILLTYHTAKHLVLTVTVADNEDFSNADGNLCETFTVHLTVTRQPFSTGVQNWGLIIRKLFGHFGAFLVLGILTALTAICFDKKHWVRRIIVLIALLLYGFAFAGLTEILQLPIFVAGRGAAFSDVLIDFSGFVPGFLILYGLYLLVVFIIERIQANKEKPTLSET